MVAYRETTGKGQTIPTGLTSRRDNQRWAVVGFVAVLLAPWSAGAQPAPSAPGADQNAPAGQNAPPLQILGALDASENYDSNAGGSAGTALGAPDAYSRGLLELGLRYDMSPLSARVDYSLTGEEYARFHELDNLTNRLNLSAIGTIIPDQLNVSVGAFAAPTLLSRLDAIATDGGPVQNISNSDTYGYSVQPNYFLRFDDYATSTTSVSQAGFFESVPPVSNAAPAIIPQLNTSSFRASEKIANGDYFSQVQWSLSGTYNENKQSTSRQTQTQGVAELDYQIDHSLAVFGTGGYSGYTASVPLAQGLSGPVASGGIRLSNGAGFRLMAQGGVQNNFPTYSATVLWQLTGMTQLYGSLTDSVSTPQGDILSNLSSFAAPGAIAVPDTGAVPTQTTDQDASAPASSSAQNPAAQVSTTSPVPPQGLALDASINRSRVATLTLLHQGVRTQYNLTLSVNTREGLGGTTIPNLSLNSSLYDATVSAQRSLRTDLTGHVSASYSLADEFGGHDHIVTLEAGLSYAMTQTFSIYMLDQYLTREIHGEVGVVNVTNSSMSENLVAIGIRRSF